MTGADVVEPDRRPTVRVAAASASGAGGAARARRRRRRQRRGIGPSGDDVASADVAGGSAGSGRASMPTVNEPLTFIQFIADHQPGATVRARSQLRTSRVRAGRRGPLLIPLSAMGEPPPRSASARCCRRASGVVRAAGARRTRRGIELALAGLRAGGRAADGRDGRGRRSRRRRRGPSTTTATPPRARRRPRGAVGPRRRTGGKVGR